MEHAAYDTKTSTTFTLAVLPISLYTHISLCSCGRKARYDSPLFYMHAGSLFEECLLLADYTAEEGHEEKQLSVKAGETVLVLNRDTTGVYNN